LYTIKKLHIAFVLLFILTTNSFSVYSQIQKGQDLDGISAGDWNGSDVSLSNSGNTIIVGSSKNDLGGQNTGLARVFDWNGINWIQRGSNIIGFEDYDLFGTNVTINYDGNIIVVSAYLNDFNGNDAGLVRIYEWNGSAWGQKGSDLLGDNPVDWFGKAIDLDSSGNTIVVGAYGYDFSNIEDGRAKVFEWSGTAWNLKGQAINGAASQDWFGYSVSISADGNRVAVGAPNHDSNGSASGEVRVFEFSGGLWTLLGGQIPGTDEGNWFGFDVSLNSLGTSVVVGAPYTDGNGDNNSGRVRVFEFDGSNWNQVGNEIIGNNANDWLGYRVSMNDFGNIIAISTIKSDGNGPNSGDISFYNYDGTVWQQFGLTIDGELTGDKFGSSLSISGDGTVMAGGAELNSDIALEQGHARVYCIPNIVTDSIEACEAYTWVNGITYTENEDTATVILLNTSGCDSIVTLHLIIDDAFSTDSVTACDNYTWLDGNTYTVSNNTATVIYSTTAGCDSIVTLALNLGYTDSITDVITACNDYTWIDGNTYTQSIDTSYYYIDQTGCDSSRHLKLTIEYIDTSVTSNPDLTMISNQDEVTYQWVDCDNNYSYLTDETNQTFVPFLNGHYAVIVSNGVCVDTSYCQTVEVIGKIGVADAFSPNNDGVNDVLTVDGIGIAELTFKIYNRYGQLVFESNDQTIGWDGTFKNKPEPEGIYVWVFDYLLMSGENGTLTGNITLLR
jgi:gliding motility-associated-like protein